MSTTMKISLRQLEQAIGTMKRGTVHDGEDIVVEVKIHNGDPGNGRLISTLEMTGSATDTYLDRNGQIKSVVKLELYEKHEKMEPVASLESAAKIKVRV